MGGWHMEAGQLAVCSENMHLQFGLPLDGAHRRGESRNRSRSIEQIPPSSMALPAPPYPMRDGVVLFQQQTMVGQLI